MSLCRTTSSTPNIGVHGTRRRKCVVAAGERKWFYAKKAKGMVSKENYDLNKQLRFKAYLFV